MPQDVSLYGKRPTKRQKHLAAPSTLDFSAQLTSFISTPSAPSSASRATKRKADGAKVASASSPWKPSSKSSQVQATVDQEDAKKLRLKNATHTDEDLEAFGKGKRKMEEKARLYAAMKRGDYVPKENEAEPLVDFDRKWVEDGEKVDVDTSDGEESELDEKYQEILEYEDEFGRLRRGTRAEKERLERRTHVGNMARSELSKMSARPAAPDNIIYGDTVQTMAFAADNPYKMEKLARNRDRSPTPPEKMHYDASKEIRSKGVGFYKFSRDEEVRQDEMESLDSARKDTETERSQVEDRKAKRKQEMEERRKKLEARRAGKMADGFLDGLLGGGKEAADTDK